MLKNGLPMNNYRRWWQAVLAALLLVFIILAWVFFAPVPVGGQASYVIINGNSMEPHYHLGDLVIVHQVPVYQVGDIVVYRNAELKSLVFHRIIGLRLDHFLMKGDNNGWTDSYQPTQSELIGKLWIYLPKAGKTVKWLRTPLVLAILAGVLGIILGIILTTRNKHGKKMTDKTEPNWFSAARDWVYRNGVARLKNSSLVRIIGTNQSKTISLVTDVSDRQPYPPRDKKRPDVGSALEAAFFTLGFITLASLVLGVLAFLNPTQRDVTDNLNFQQTGVFSYSTTAPAGIYDTTTISSGQPLFPNLNCLVKMQFKYLLLGNQLQGLAGTHQLTAIILDDQSGWQRTIPLESRTSFAGNNFTTAASLDLCNIETTVAAMEKATNLHPSSYSLTITPLVTITGQIAGRKLQSSFGPQLLFRFDNVHFYLFKSDALTDPLNPSQTGIVENKHMQANTLSLFGLKPEVGMMRTVSLIGLFLSLGGLLALGIFISNKMRSSQEALIQMKYSSMLVDIQDRALELSSPAIDVVTMDDLAKLAERNSGVILHEARGLIHSYFVQGDRIVYRFKLNDEGESISDTQSLQLKENLIQGLERGEFQVYYQPIFSVPDGRISAVEALLRWQHPQRGLVPATEFIFAAEKTGLIDRLGEWMLQVACARFAQWQKAGIRVRLAVNLSERQLVNEPADFISRVLESTGMDPHTLQIEIPESSLMGNIPNVLQNLQKLSRLGIQISVDGFAGQSPLSSLEQFQVNSVKIDRRVVGRIGDPENAFSVSNMISDVRSLGLNVVAEGVETQEQLEFLRSNLCTLAQGYFLGRPVPADEVTLLLEQDKSPDYAKPSRRRPRSEKDIR
jgi:signal peptidase I